jgi:hypothetical protein
MSSDQDYIVIPGKIDGQRVESRLLEEQLQSAVAQGHTRLKIEAYGQQGIGGRLWKAGDKRKSMCRLSDRSASVRARWDFPIRGSTFWPHFDDVGWLNAGAEIVVHGNAANGACQRHGSGQGICGRQHRRPRHDHDQAQPPFRSPLNCGCSDRPETTSANSWPAGRRDLRACAPGSYQCPRLPPPGGNGGRQGIVPRTPQGFQPNRCRHAAHR